MGQYTYPGGQNNQQRKTPACTPSRSGKQKWLEWTIFALFLIDIFCQFLTAWVADGFWWVGLGVDVLVLMFMMFLLVK